MTDGAKRHAAFWALVVVLLAVMATLQFTTVRHETQTADEGRQLISGYTYLTTGHFTVAIEHPPLLKLLWAVPVWFLHPDSPRPGDAWKAAVDFLYHNRVPADTMLMAGRGSAIAISVLLGLAIAFWGSRLFGMPAALFAVFVYAADPNFLANGRYIKNDVGAALMIFAATMIWGEYLMNTDKKRLWLSGVVVGLALTTKSSDLILGPVMLLLYALRRWQQQRNFGTTECFRAFSTVGAIAFLVVFAVYGFEFETIGASPRAFRILPGASWLAHIPVPAFAYIRGLGKLGVRESGDALQVSYLLGKQSRISWWYMSPVAFAVKTPLAELALFALALVLAVRRLRDARFREIGFRWFLCSVPVACYFFAAVISHNNVGERHLLPLYPFLFLSSGGLLLTAPVPRWRQLAIAACGLTLVIETGSIHPHYLAFFNALAGGPAGGREFLVDSNLDWGQDLKNLKEYLDANHINEVCINYYGWADLDYYHIPHRILPEMWDVTVVNKLNCVAAISATHLAVYHRNFAALDGIQPDARIGYSIYVYDLRNHP